MNEIKDLIREYESTAILWGEALDCADHRRANKYIKKLNKIKKELIEKESIKEIESLLNSQYISVRYCAACDLIFEYEKEAVKVLEEIIKKERGLIAFSADMYLSEWKKGNIKNIIW